MPGTGFMDEDSWRIIIAPPVRRALRAIARSGTSEARHVERAKMILMASAGKGAGEIARLLNCKRDTVRKWCDRFVASPTVSAIEDESRPGKPRVIPVEVRCDIVKYACSHPSDWKIEAREIWTLGALRDVLRSETGFELSEMEISRTLRDSEIRPHRMKLWLNSPDPDFRAKVKKICHIYTNPPKDTHVLCIDEKTSIQALDRNYKNKLPTKGKAGKIEFEYERNGTTSLIGAFEVKTGKAYGVCSPTRTAEDMLSFMDMVAGYYKGKVIVIWDNLNTHTGERWDTFNSDNGSRFQFEHTPIHASWMNQIEIWFGILHRRVIKYGVFPSVDDLIAKIQKFITQWNAHEAHPFNWKFRGEFAKASGSLGDRG